jgi:hypothetical protein
MVCHAKVNTSVTEMSHVKKNVNKLETNCVWCNTECKQIRTPSINILYMGGFESWWYPAPLVLRELPRLIYVNSKKNSPTHCIFVLNWVCQMWRDSVQYMDVGLVFKDSLGGVSLLGMSATNWPIVPAPDDTRRWWWMWRSRWNENWHGKPKQPEENLPSATLSTTNSTRPDLASNPVRRGGKSATNRLSYGTANV